ncbi:MAG TPA: hypothetical protein PL029_07205 [Bacteroidia bacterium]|nr:hypothetical protein [Bacteroidia bacterium]
MRKYLFFILSFTVIFSSCIVFNSGNVSSGPLLNVTDKYVDIATGESKTTRLLGLGGQFSHKMILEAKTNLFKSRPLRTGEYYSNFSCDISKKIILGIVYITRVTVSAEVLRVQESGRIETGRNGTDSVYKLAGNNFNTAVGLYNLKTYFVNQVDSFVIGEKIFYNVNMGRDFGKYEITAISGSNITIKPVYGSGSNIIVPAENIMYSTKKGINGFCVGESVKWGSALTGSTGIIIATSLNRVLLYSENGYKTQLATKLKKIR